MKIGLIGTGNMGSALMGGYLKANPERKSEVFAFDVNRESLQAFVTESGAIASDSLLGVVEQAEIIILAVKPNVMAMVLDEIKGVSSLDEKIIVSIAAGISMDFLEKGLQRSGEDKRALKIVRAMPNTPALIGKGMTALIKGDHVNQGEFEEIKKIFSSVGGIEEIKEELMDSVIGVSGSAPAYVYMFIEAMADGAVALGMDRQQAYRFAAGTVAGAAEMVTKTGIHPGELKDRVCSPGGTTIEAVKALEDAGFRSAVTGAVMAAGIKSKEMSKYSG